VWSVSDRFREYSLLQSIQTGYVASTVRIHRVLGSTFPRDKADGAVPRFIIKAPKHPLLHFHSYHIKYMETLH